MLSMLLVLGCVADLVVPGSCCGLQEYETRDGQCCPTCHEGTAVRRDCTSQSGTRCTPCEDGTFMNTTNGLNTCFSCTSCDQGRGLFSRQECTATSDAVCDVETGYFCTSLADVTGCSLAEKHRRCEPGQRIKEPGTSRTDTVCELCQPGYFSQHGVNCTAWTTCSETEVKLREGSTSSDVVCGAAARKRFFYIPVLLSLLLSSTLVGVVVIRAGQHCKNIQSLQYRSVFLSESHD